MVGMINVFQGLVALIWDERVLVTEDNFVLVDMTSWGWVVLLSGALMIAVSASLFGARTWARFAAIVIVIVHAASQILWLGAFPLWSLLMIGLDTVVLFALTARWSAARDSLSSYGNPGDGTPGEVTPSRAQEMRSYQRYVT
jgi:hypothetical protein